MAEESEAEKGYVAMFPEKPWVYMRGDNPRRVGAADLSEVYGEVGEQLFLQHCKKNGGIEQYVHEIPREAFDSFGNPLPIDHPDYEEARRCDLALELQEKLKKDLSYCRKRASDLIAFAEIKEEDSFFFHKENQRQRTKKKNLQGQKKPS